MRSCSKRADFIISCITVKKRGIAPFLFHQNFRKRFHTAIGEALQVSMDIAPLFMGIGMHCLGCPSSQGESIADACMVHGVAPDELVAKINNVLADK